MYILGGSIVVAVLVILYLRHVSQGMSGVPEEVIKLSPHRWTEKEVRDTYERIKKDPIDFTPHLPPKQDRRYVVVGGSGLVGGHIVLHLLARGQSPESIRIIDFRAPYREDMLDGPASKIPFVQADISSSTSTNTAFNQKWPKGVSSLPLTVFHTAALINAYERQLSLLHKCIAVNTTGSSNVIAAAKESGADILIATSSASLAVRPPNFWLMPWEKWPQRYLQILDERDADEPLRKHGEYFGNYGYTKAMGERIILKANSSTFKTGTIRPGNGIYGNKYDQTSGNYLKRGDVPTWIPHIRQNFVSGENISLSHLLFESALLAPNTPASGKTFVISDPNPTAAFQDLYLLLSTLSATGFKTTNVPGLPLFLMSYVIEQYHTLQSRIPNVLPALPEDLKLMQPTLFNISNGHYIVDDSAARRSVESGGLGYKGVATTMEGMCMQVKKWNADHENPKESEKVGDGSIVREVKNVGAVAGASKS